MAKMVAQSASRALGLLIAKCKSAGGLPYNVYSRLYDALVRPVLEYGAGIFGLHDYHSINNVHNRACRYFMGVGRYTPTAAVRGEMGWKEPVHCQRICVIRLWCHLCAISNSRLPRKIFLWSADLPNRFKSWPHLVRKMLHEFDLDYLCNTNIVHDKKSSIAALDHHLKLKYETEWLGKINREQGNIPGSRNKLRTYRHVKESFTAEIYLQLPILLRDRRAMARFRVGLLLWL